MLLMGNFWKHFVHDCLRPYNLQYTSNMSKLVGRVQLADTIKVSISTHPVQIATTQLRVWQPPLVWNPEIADKD